MILNFKNIEFKNIQSYGNAVTKLQLDKYPTQCISGKNGHGKSTIMTALFFALYGKSYTKITKNDLVNKINDKNMLVTVEFSNGVDEYKVIRGAKPNVFDVFKNGTQLHQNASVRDDQKHFETHILGIPEKTFRQTVMLSASSHTPFMRLSISDKREVIEDLLDIKIFSNMNIIAKQEASEIAGKIESLNNDINLVNNSINHIYDYIKDFENKEDQIKQELIQDIESKKNEHRDIEDKIEVANDKLLELSRLGFDKIPTLNSKLSKIKTFKSGFEKDIKRLTAEISFYEDNDHCPTCSQDINHSLKESKTVGLIEERNKFAEGCTKANDQITEIDASITELSEIKKEYNSIRDSITILKSQLNAINTEIDKLESKSTNIQSGETLHAKKNELEFEIKNLSTLEEDLLKLKVDLGEYRSILELLKDTGIKTKIVRTYIPLINKLMSKYLGILDFPIDFIFDETFDTSIKYKGRTEMNYLGLSEGEKARVDLALLFTFRELSKIKSGFSTNLLLFDELTDSSLDKDGWDAFMKIIKDSDSQSNVFVISHKGEAISYKFDSLLKVEKFNNFSKITHVIN